MELSWILILGWFLVICRADVCVIDRLLNNTELDEVFDYESTFGPEVSDVGVRGILFAPKPAEGCSKVQAPPAVFPSMLPLLYKHWIALLDRGNCTYVTKVLNVQAAGYHAVIVVNTMGDEIEPMSALPDTARNVSIPSVIVGRTDGASLRKFFRNYNRFSIRITPVAFPFNIEKYLLPFAVTIGLCFLAMVIYMLVKCVRDYRKSRKHRLSWRELRRLPLLTFGDDTEPHYEVCAICLEDYAAGDRLRQLPCRHAYHSRCIDPWLTKRRRVCPVCKARVRTTSTLLRDSDSDDTEAEQSTSETAPLLRQAQPPARTFVPQPENPFRRANRLAAQRSTSSSGSGSPEAAQDAVVQTEESEHHQASSSAAMLPNSDEENQSEQVEVVTVMRKKRRRKTRRQRSSERRTPSRHDRPRSTDPRNDRETSTDVSKDGTRGCSLTADSPSSENSSDPIV